jgi:hypothetical protein
MEQTISSRNFKATGTLRKRTPHKDPTMLEDLRVLTQPGAIVAVSAILLLMAGGSVPILIAAKGWPF